MFIFVLKTHINYWHKMLCSKEAKILSINLGMLTFSITKYKIINAPYIMKRQHRMEQFEEGFWTFVTAPYKKD